MVWLSNTPSVRVLNVLQSTSAGDLNMSIFCHLLLLKGMTEFMEIKLQPKHKNKSIMYIYLKAFFVKKRKKKRKVQ